LNKLTIFILLAIVSLLAFAAPSFARHWENQDGGGKQTNTTMVSNGVMDRLFKNGQSYKYLQKLRNSKIYKLVGKGDINFSDGMLKKYKI
jgi:hypothetical protein